jgi:4'-phosphopantetheinyl transferase
MADDCRCELFLAGLDRLRPWHHELLSDAEQQRAARFRFAADRDRFVLASALLRVAVADRTGTQAGAVRLDRSCDRCGELHGRPRLPGTGLYPSISHSGDVVAVALTDRGPVGIDVEAMSSRNYEPLVPRVCRPEERPHVARAADFYAYWTRKEAVLKATGDGLRRPMNTIAVTPPPDAPALLALGDSLPPACQMADVAAGPGYAAAVAVLADSPLTFREIGAGPLLRVG